MGFPDRPSNIQAMCAMCVANSRVGWGPTRTEGFRMSSKQTPISSASRCLSRSTCPLVSRQLCPLRASTGSSANPIRSLFTEIFGLPTFTTHAVEIETEGEREREISLKFIDSQPPLSPDSDHQPHLVYEPWKRFIDPIKAPGLHRSHFFEPDPPGEALQMANGDVNQAGNRNWLRLRHI